MTASVKSFFGKPVNQYTPVISGIEYNDAIPIHGGVAWPSDRPV